MGWGCAPASESDGASPDVGSEDEAGDDGCNAGADGSGASEGVGDVGAVCGCTPDAGDSTGGVGCWPAVDGCWACGCEGGTEVSDAVELPSTDGAA